MPADIKAYEKMVYDRWGERYDRSIWVSWLRVWVKGYGKDVPERSRILDIGCSTGNALTQWVEQKPVLLAGVEHESS
jgi:SAM-dependent methyltransferase